MVMFKPPHPGSLIAEYLEDNGISLRSLAKQLGVSAASLSKVANGKVSVSPEMAVRLETGLGIAARLWLSMQAAYDLHKVRETTDVSGVPLHPGIVTSLGRDGTA
ncbi:HigA family addiction module antidote protein [Pantoea sp. Bo_2]|uniref:HigA family addiction module antidote protein n=1 Tax=Candidatus Pantoea gossypiicola TaxID=2608008 RepID=A0AB34CMS5_9GAMM|nr:MULTISPECIES: HigA family addiction module antitoxin [Pantoea]KAA5927458.1 HigA family addiction module antidote protein [Pantoea sp. VH_8]KAA5931797.1 HigA family addiction module antidote protein [Pantoea sp. VH_4]KAA5939462.1 HigA family addiction module antidote protein [Pantoea sp. VH_3]KAA5948430.1 HigA family addiction module antidote protein [Pantoea sp. VH_25]KAA5951542.1 HigA family addiction module antidote protein [Pantoea sp. VH_24]